MTDGRFASNAALALANDLGLADVAIVGTGRDGRVTLSDVRNVAAKVPAVPNGLEDAGAELWRSVHRDYELRADEETILVEACRTLDELRRLQAKLASASTTVAGSRGQVKPHPLFAEVRAHRLALRQLLSSIGISEVDDSSGDAFGQARSNAGRQLAMQRHHGGRRG